MATDRQTIATMSDEASPFSTLKHCKKEDLFILTTRSLDEENTTRDQGESDEKEAPKIALDTSFESTDMNEPKGSTPYPSDDDVDVSERSGRKHMRLVETTEVNLPGTVRKQARTFTKNPPATTTTTTSRLRSHGTTTKKSSSSTTAPSSAAKRRRAQWQPDRSAVPGVSPTPFHGHLSSPPSSTIKYLDSSIFHSCASPARTPNISTGIYGTSTILSKYYNTATTTGTTTASTAVETTLESSDSIGTSSPTTTRFRFTSFPASLPRVNNPRSRDCPESLRKRIPFATDPLFSSSQQSDNANQSRDDDGTQNTSISSLSADGHQHMALAPGGLVPPTILNLHAPSDENNLNRPIHANLFADDDDDEEFGYSDDEDADQEDDGNEGEGDLAGQQDVAQPDAIVGRTRLNFNAVMSPTKETFKSPLAGMCKQFVSVVVVGFVKNT